MRLKAHQDEILAPNTNFSLWKLLDHTGFVISRSREMELAKFGISPEQEYVLDILRQSAGRTTISNIVNVTERQHHTMSTLITRMSEKGLVDKKKAPGDNRRYYIIITNKGKQVASGITTKSIEEIFASLNDGEKGQLRTYLNNLLAKVSYILGEGSIRPVLRFKKEV
jgi:DNA-binding MarR family transcriptional regulator